MSTALYRRYRPDNFGDVIGQEHVTVPLMTALSKDRVNHAYLFSGPRGCGKTTSARILARCLNCAQGPTPTPCGTCPSCVELASGGPGSLDVIEIDAASHGGVDDARDLRERATFAPVRDRYKVFIIDEAHMVTPAGFNALLKIVEEPPEHIKFIFATTEPDKVIGTIRSRTHHYPFRLVPPEPLHAYLQHLCDAESVAVAPGVLSLVIRAGGGSVRDSLSVLDQLMAGAGENGMDYELAVSLLGFTHSSLLDDVLEALATRDAATIFGAVDRVVQTGHDPRRFVEDLLERFRDLIIVKAVPENAASIIRGLPEDQLARMQAQAANLGQAELSRSADVTNSALTEMTGATSPRLHLELLCARLLLPATDSGERGINARIDRVERLLASGVPMAAGATGSAPDPVDATAPRIPHDGSGGFDRDSASAPLGGGAAAVREALRAARQQVAGEPAAAAPGTPAPTPEPVPATAPAASAEPVTGPAPSAAPSPADPAPAVQEATAQEPAAPEPDPASNDAEWGSDWGDMQQEPATGTPAASVAASPAPAAAPVPQFSIVPERVAPEVDQVPAAAARQAQQQAPPDLPQAPDTATQTPAPEAHTRGPASGGSIEPFQQAWPQILEDLKNAKKFLWMMVQPNASPTGYDGRTLTVSFAHTGALTAFTAKQENVMLLGQSINRVTGVDCQLVITAGGTAPAGGSGPKADRRREPAAPSTVTPLTSARPTGSVPTTTPDGPATAQAPASAAAPVPMAAATQPPEAPAPLVPAPAEQTVRPVVPVPAVPAPALQADSPASPVVQDVPAAPAPAAAAPSRRRGPAPASAPTEEDPGYGPEPDFGDEPWDDGAGDWSADNVPVPEWEFPAPGGAPGASLPAPGAARPSPTTGPALPLGEQDLPVAPAPAGFAGPAGSAASAVSAGSGSPVDTAASAPRSSAPMAIPTWAAPEPNQETMPLPPAAASDTRPGQKVSRYQRLMNQGPGASAPAASGGFASAFAPEQPGPAFGTAPDSSATSPGTWGNAPSAPEPGRAVESKYVEDIPSDDDIAIEESGVVGRPAIERLLNGRLIEERDHQGNIIPQSSS
ncbi:DNA polymerase III subunit gamma and tau [Paeniglutamicibacter cryotolerans]|uniref:DNA polymerase III subunit gamma/tau n=1 Tax=Paeniglutamicibacter cryotolerans TaxID=670079 RepID=A0A839QMG5_9MICC|nr:DNA polymerase III subunit gamma and tau [Paeniglutamicibacter cryotolerans]MBB2995196.1 DNA polymerase-3 subunit gamma/tau [Paeniglutamicibacter cryotolerans]